MLCRHTQHLPKSYTEKLADIFSKKKKNHQELKYLGNSITLINIPLVKILSLILDSRVGFLDGSRRGELLQSWPDMQWRGRSRCTGFPEAGKCRGSRGPCQELAALAQDTDKDSELPEQMQPPLLIKSSPGNMSNEDCCNRVGKQGMGHQPDQGGNIDKAALLQLQEPSRSQALILLQPPQHPLEK